MSEKIKKIFYLYLISIPLLDCISGIFINNRIIIGFIYFVKLLFILFVVCTIFFINKKYRKYLFALVCYSLLFLLINGDFKEKNDLIYEIGIVIKIIYLPLILLFVIENIKDFKLKYLFIVFLEYLLLIFIPNILNIGHNSYAYSKEGQVGFFISANVIGNIFSILYPIILLYLLKTNKKIHALVISTFYIYTILTMGTKGPLICLILLLLYFIVYLLIKLVKNKKYYLLIIGFVLFTFATFLFTKIITKTAFYENLIIHLNFLNVHSFKDLLSFEKIDHFIFGSRFKMLNDSFQVFINSSLLNKLFGIGYMNNNILKTCEMDYFVTLIHNGIIGFMIIYSVYFYFVFNLIKEYIKKFFNNFMNIKKTLIHISLFFTILCAFFVGHTLDVPSVSIYVAIIINLCIQQRSNSYEK